jgi:hypothetical protein
MHAAAPEEAQAFVTLDGSRIRKPASWVSCCAPAQSDDDTLTGG